MTSLEAILAAALTAVCLALSPAPAGAAGAGAAEAATMPDYPPDRGRLDSLLRGKYLDCHAHTAGIGAKGSGCYVGKGLRESWKFPIYLKAFGVTEEELETLGDGIVMERLSARLAESKTVGAAVVLALDGPLDSVGDLDSARTELYVPNDFVAREVRKYPNLLFGASINPLRKDALDRLRKAKADGAVLVKWLPSIQLFDPADTSLVPFYLELKALGLPLLTHTGKESSFHSAKDEYCDPRRLELPVSLGVIVIAAHVATPGKSEGEDNSERLMAMMPRHPTLYSEISSLTQINKIGRLPKILPRVEVKGRLLFGTDYPLIRTSLVSPYYFLHRIGWKQAREVGAIDNPWDRDVALKKALGVPEEIFRLSADMLLKDWGKAPTVAASPDSGAAIGNSGRF
jgi:predicted TIM-barrel fold metal-dependent hydrolase